MNKQRLFLWLKCLLRQPLKGLNKMRKVQFQIIILFIIFLAGCSDNAVKPVIKCEKLNLAHLGYLYSEVNLKNGAKAGIVHIYSEYPDYSYNIEPKEGFACIDDVARAVVLLANCPDDSFSESRLAILDKMMDFILYMQSDSGYFYNFIWHDGSINTTYRTSQAVPDWWSWRAFWAMEEYAAINTKNAGKIDKASKKLAEKIFGDLVTADRSVSEIEGVLVPTWLPGKAACDQSADLILALEKYYRRTNDNRAPGLMTQLAEGILVMQAGDSLNFPYGAFLSWNNTWHAYGNVQAYALLRSGVLLGRKDYIDKALVEVDNFYPWLIQNGYLNYFTIKRTEGKYEITEQEKFPQIAYGIRPVVYACIEASRITGKEKYLEMAKQAAGWLAGKNPAGKVMWDPLTGRGFDGIISEGKINMNAGAESTIEALLALQALEQ
jgi:hypothetical protein